MRRVIDSDGALLVHGQCFATDVELATAFRSYSSTGRLSRLTQWPGSYSVLASRFDADLTVAADLAGQFPVYFSPSTNGFWFASDATSLARMIGADVDRDALSLHLLGLDSPMISRDRTQLAGVHRVEAEWAVRVDRRHRLTRLDVGITSGGIRCLGEAAEVLRPQLIEAVRLRAGYRGRQPMSADLSGGIDSSCLAFLAAGHRSTPLPVLTQHSTAAPVESDRVRAASLACMNPLFEHHLVTGTAAEAPFQLLAEAPILDLPGNAAIVFARSRLRLAAASAAGSRLHMTGDGGDLLAGATPVCLADLAQTRDYPSLLRHCAAWARLRQRPTIALLLRAHIAGSLTPRQALRRLAADLSAKSPAWAPVWEDMIAYWEHPRAASDWLTSRARKSVVTSLCERADTADFPQGWLVSDYAVRSELASCGPVQHLMRAVAESFGMELHSPYLDTNILRTCLSLPASRRTSPTEAKPLLRRALTGLVPSAVLERTTKGDYSRDQYIGLRRAEPVLKSLIRSSVSADMGIVEPRSLLTILERAALGVDIPWAAFTRFIAVELWLHRFYNVQPITAKAVP